MSAPQLLCFHPGGFVHGDPSFESAAVDYAHGLGFQAVSANYPLTSLAEQRTWSITMAGALAAAGPVYAYGDSAGGTLAAFLATRARVQAAACYGSPPDVWSFLQRPFTITNNWPLLGSPSEAECDLTSPAKHLAQVPVHAYRGASDTINPIEDYIAWDDGDPLVTWLTVDGGHLNGGAPDPTYLTNMKRAIDWLAFKAGILFP